MSADADGRPGARLLARLLRQLREMGEERILLEGLSRRQLDAVASRLRAGRSAAGAGAATASPGEGGDGAKRRDGSPAPDPAQLSPEEREVREGENGEELLRTLSYDRVRAVALGCQRCRLAEGRTQVVFSDGNPDGRLMVVGEAPGAREDETGLPFVGPAGKLLDLLLASVDLSREESVYICNVLKCRPPGNRDPLADEIEACTPYLRRQIDLVSPELILGVGKFAGQFLTGRSSALGKLRGEVYSYEGVPVVVTYHPAALLRNSGWTRATWDDFQLVRRILDGG